MYSFIGRSYGLTILFGDLQTFRVPNIMQEFPKKSFGGNFFLKVNQTGRDLINKISPPLTCPPRWSGVSKNLEDETH